VATLNDLMKAFYGGPNTLNDEMKRAFEGYLAAGGTAGSLLPPMGDQLTSGFAVVPERRLPVTATAVVSGSMIFTYFTAPESGTFTQMRVGVGAVAQATSTLVRVGVYSVAANGGLTLIGSSTHSGTQFNTINTLDTVTLSTPAVLTAGSRYAWAPLVVGGTMPQIIGPSAGGTTNLFTTLAPRLNATFSGQSDLPASVATGSLSIANITFQAIFTP
jgi:hypothetical protein